MTPDQAKQLAEIRSLVQYGTWGYKGTGKADAWALLNGLVVQQAAQSATIKALATALGNQHPGVDTAALVAAVTAEINKAVPAAVAATAIDVDVTVHDAKPTV